MLKLLTITLATMFAAVALFAGAAQAKGPMNAEVSGGDLTAPIVLERELNPDALFAHYIPETGVGYIHPPLPYPEVIYMVQFFMDEDGERADLFRWTYYPAHDGMAAAVRDDKQNFLAVPGDLQQMLNDALPQTVEASASSDGGHGDGDSGSYVWYLAPSLALGLVVIGGGLAGRRLLKRQRE